MGLVSCPDCDARVSDLAPACIGCGRPIAGFTDSDATVVGTTEAADEAADAGEVEGAHDPNRPLRFESRAEYEAWKEQRVAEARSAGWRPEPSKRSGESRSLSQSDWLAVSLVGAAVLGLTGVLYVSHPVDNSSRETAPATRNSAAEARPESEKQRQSQPEQPSSGSSKATPEGADQAAYALQTVELMCEGMQRISDESVAAGHPFESGCARTILKFEDDPSSWMHVLLLSYRNQATFSQYYRSELMPVLYTAHCEATEFAGGLGGSVQHVILDEGLMGTQICVPGRIAEIRRWEPID